MGVVLARGGIAARCATAAAAILAAAPVCGAWAQTLNEPVQRLISAARIGHDTRVGVYVVDVHGGATLASVRANEGFTPASNQKLLTSGAALEVLGPDFVFATELVRDGEDLVIVGAGDPAFADPDVLDRLEPRLTVDDVLDTLAQSAVKAGVKRAAHLTVDDRVFDRQLVHPTWPAHQLSDWYCAEVSGVIFHTNVLSVFPRPSPDGNGKRPTFSVQPSAAWLSVENRATTTVDGKNAVSLVRVSDANQFRMSGEVRYAAQVPVETTVHDPSLFFGQVLADRLERAGVSVGDEHAPASGPNPAVRLIDPDGTVKRDRVLARVTTPLADVMRRCNRDSHNLYAEAMLKRVGHETTHEPGSWASGAAVVRMLLSQKIDPEAASSTVIADGSGMSRDNSVSPRTLARWLAAIAGESPAVAETFVESLARPGEGTLRERFQSPRPKNLVRAKSGYIKGVRSLSGFLTSPDGSRRVAFSILINGVPEDSGAAAKRLHEDIVLEIDRWMTRQGGPARGTPGG